MKKTNHAADLEGLPEIIAVRKTAKAIDTNHAVKDPIQRCVNGTAGVARRLLDLAHRLRVYAEALKKERYHNAYKLLRSTAFSIENHAADLEGLPEIIAVRKTAKAIDPNTLAAAEEEKK